ncbi:hypothetical protein L226DRAFT_616609 [Lentinus tigrinus ALCF2SS1-7]|uniref:Uncharacterized protein n=1 Tax=Lentinus tigrinus ALCF2SS1-6 TaxID=1328759 RepID=A0A5C2S6H1_9APHY|nr:hypothetical protein L227DRAFT_612616 [Lentinus tigrinus ALCF2SS1-6]RPD69857.1 hypothetical protein L226DRAFT_616609 [Lentinus tigrinus ALCF2SS1-7]
MRFTTKLVSLASVIVAATAGRHVTATPASVASIMSTDEIYHWLDTIDTANVTFIGKPIDRDAPLSAEDIMVFYCSQRSGNDCVAPCTVYVGGATCLYAPNTNCLGASANVDFCDGSGCSGSCNQLATCGVRMNLGFCYTPGTNSIIVPPS